MFLQTSPRFIQKIDCVYVFMWEVPEVCGGDSGTVSTQGECSYSDPATGETYDLKQLQMATPFEV